MKRIAVIVYLVIGVAVAAAQNYLGNIGNIADFVNLLLAIVLWPLLLVGVDFNLSFGGGKDGNKKGALFMLGARFFIRAREPRLLGRVAPTVRAAHLARRARGATPPKSVPARS